MNRRSVLRTVLGVILMGALAWEMSKPGAAVPAVDSTRGAPSRDGWPDTKAGEVAYQWVRAFSTGEAAMREFYRKALSTESLAKRSAEARIENYRRLRERFGKLMLAETVKSTPGELTAALMDADGARHEFVFTVETERPYHLVSVALRDLRHAGHGGGFH